MSLLLFLSLHILNANCTRSYKQGPLFESGYGKHIKSKFHSQTKCKALISRWAFILAITMMWLKNILRFLNEAWFTALVFALMDVALPSSLYQTWLAKSPLVQSVSVTKSHSPQYDSYPALFHQLLRHPVFCLVNFFFHSVGQPLEMVQCCRLHHADDIRD